MAEVPAAGSMEAYYERRAGEYDEWYLGLGLFAPRDRPGFADELEEVRSALVRLRPARTLDVGCGTGYITRHLQGSLTSLDRSRAMLGIARHRVPGPMVRGDALRLPFRDGSFERVFAGHLYGHLTAARAGRFRSEAFRVAPELVVLDGAVRPEVEPEQVQERTLNDGSTHRVYKRFFDPGSLVKELGRGEVLVGGRWFVLVACAGGPPTPTD
jgi:SAM-dependent methyltransferase